MMDSIIKTCTKCHGTGNTGHTHIEDGKCFDCDGKGIQVKTLKQTRAAILRAIKKQEKIQAEENIKLDNFKKACEKRKRRTDKIVRLLNLKTFEDSNKKEIADISVRVFNRKNVETDYGIFTFWLALGDDGFVYSFKSESNKVLDSYWSNTKKDMLNNFDAEEAALYHENKRIKLSGLIEDKAEYNVAKIASRFKKNGYEKAWNCDLPVVHISKPKFKKI